MEQIFLSPVKNTKDSQRIRESLCNTVKLIRDRNSFFYRMISDRHRHPQLLVVSRMVETIKAAVYSIKYYMMYETYKYIICNLLKVVNIW